MQPRTNLAVLRSACSRVEQPAVPAHADGETVGHEPRPLNASMRLLPLLRFRAAASAAFVLALTLTCTSARAVEVVEYYHAGLDHYFVTNLAEEKRALDAGVFTGWVRTGQTFQVFEEGDARLANSVPVCRFYGNPARGLDSHFYSASPDECAAVQQRFPDDWLLEAEALFRVHGPNPNGTCPASTLPVYRLYNGRTDVNHRYTTDAATADAMVAKGYAFEGIGTPRPVVFCAANIAPPAVLAGAPACTIVYSTLLPVLGQPVTMTASCTNAPTTYAWINCASTTATCTTTVTEAGPVVYGLVASNSQGPGAVAKTTLNWQPLAAAVPSCSLGANTTAPTVGTSLVLTAACAGSPVVFEWLACSPLTPDACSVVPQCATASTTCSPVSTQQGAVLYALRASNNAGTSARSSVTVDWRAPQPPPSNAPMCSLVASSQFPAINSTLTLTASCSSAPTVYEWIGCASTTNVCTTTSSTIGQRSYTIYARNAAGVSPAAIATVTWQVPPTAPPSCTLSAEPSNPYAGGTTILTANCTQSPKSFSWVNCSNATGNTCLATRSQTGQVMYSVTASNELGTSAPASITLTWGPPPPVGADFCGNFDNVKRVDLVWGGQFTTIHPDGGFEDDQILVGRFTVPSNATGTSTPGLITASEFVNGPAERTMTLSPSACDFRGFQDGVFPTPDPVGALRPIAWSFGIGPSMQFALAGMPNNLPKLVPGQTYFVNIRNRAFEGGGVSCTTAECNVRITVNVPK